jgi:hypothetical protein
METTRSTAYAFMIMLAGLAVIAHYGRASAEVAPPSAYESGMNAPQGYGAAVRAAGYQPQYGLIQTGMLGVAQMDANGGFGRPAAMPVFQVIQLQPAGASGQASYEAPSNMGGAQTPAQGPAVASAEPTVPQGMSVTVPEAQMGGTFCDIKGIRVLTQSAETCGQAGGQPVTQ